MRWTSAVQALGRLAFGAILLLSMVASVNRTAVADGGEQPLNVVAFPNAPGLITLTWSHSGDDVYWFVVEQESPYVFWQVNHDTSAWSVTGLTPSTTYRYRVCAVYDFNRVCSDENGVGWASVTTFAPPTPPQQPQQPPAPADPGDQLPAFVGSFESINYPGHLMRHSDYLGFLAPMVSDLDRADATFVLHPGLSGAPDSVTFESTNYPGYFLRHQSSRIKLQQDDGSDLFKLDATFARRPGGCRGVYCQVRFESVNYPGSFIRHTNYELWIAPDDGSELFRLDSTWRRVPPPRPNFPPATVSFQSTNYPDRFIRHSSYLGFLTPIASDLDRADSAFVVRPGLNGSTIAVSLESVNYPGHFLRHQDFRIKLNPYEDSDLYRQDASFFYNDGSCGEGNCGVSLESVNNPGYFIRHSNFELWIGQNDGSELFIQDATWQPRPPR
jgi:hypothetical protein